MPPETRSPGRPRSVQAQRAILDAAWEAVLRNGFAEASIDAIAAAAGVSKTTIYRWWPRKSALILDAALEQVRSVVNFRDTGDVRADIEREMRSVIKFYIGGRPGKALQEVVAASNLDPDLEVDVVDRLIEPVSAAARARLQKGIDDGQLRPDADCDLLVHVLWGAVYHNLLVAHQPIKPAYARSILDLVWPAIVAPAARASTAKTAH